MKKNLTRIAAVAATAGLVFAVALPAEAATVSSNTATKLQALTAEEKLAHDVYLTLGNYWNARRFANISSSESRHYTAMQSMLKAYGVVDNSAGDAVGVFDDPAIQALYDALVAEGKSSLGTAYGVGVTIEQRDIADLDALLLRWMPSDIKTVLANLRAGSQNHLQAFSR